MISYQVRNFHMNFLYNENNYLKKEYLGHIWHSIQKFPLYAQDRRVAIASLVCVNLMFFQIAVYATQMFKYFFPLSENISKMKQKIIESISSLIGFGIIFGGVALFIHKSQLPFKPPTLIAISIAVLVGRMLLQNNNK